MATVRAPPTSLTQWNAQQQETADQVDVARLVATIQNTLRQRGLVAWVSLCLSLEKAQQGEGTTQGLGLGRAALRRVLNDNQLSVSEVDTRALLRCLGSQDEGRTTAEAVKNLLCGPLTDRRLELVQSVFDQLDKQRLGYVATADVVASHDGSKHPSVMFGERTAAQVHDEFLSSFHLLTQATTSSGFVNQYQWMSYFQCVSGHVPSDEYFDLVLKRVWKAAPPRTSLIDATVSSTKPVAAVAPLSLLQALQDSKATVALPPPSPAALPQRLHRSQSLNSTLGDTPKAVHTKADFLKGSQFAACMVDPGLRTPSPSSQRTPSVDALDPGTQSVLSRLRSAIKHRGLPSLVRLTRQIRLADSDGDGLLTLPEFKAAIHEDGVALSESDLRVLFKFLDRDHRGAIPVKLAMDFIRHPLSKRRHQLVHAAFELLLPPGAQDLDPADVVQRYDAARHPDVIAGRKTDEQVFHEFIDNFDMDNGDTNTGRISRAQWEHYYQNLGFFVQDDEYLELLLRNTWQLAGEAFATTTPGASASTPGATTLMEKRVVRGFTTGHNSRQTFAILQPELGEHHAAVLASERLGRAHPSSGVAPPYSTAPQSKELRRIVHTVRSALKEQGVVGFLSLQRQFQRMDADGNGSLSVDELASALRQANVLSLSAADVQQLFHYFDTNHDGAIDRHELLRGLREPMNERRALFVRMAFDLLDRDRNGVLEVADIVGVYDARRHPEVLSGRKTQEDVLAEFLESFDVTHTGATLSFAEWTAYYENLSASIDDDDYFELMMRNAWHISGGEGWSANSANRRLLVAHADGSATVEEVQNDLGVTSEHAASVLAMQLAQRSGTSTMVQRASFYDVLDHTPRPTTAPAGGRGMVRNRNNSSDAIAACMGVDAKKSEELHVPVRRGSSVPQSVPQSVPPPSISTIPAGVQAIITRLKTVLKQRGAHGFCGLSRTFRVMDEDGNGSLNLAEFKRAMAESGLSLVDADVRLLFHFFDRDRSGAIDLSEFLYGVRDPMGERRVAFVRLAFQRMDKDGNGLLEPSDIVEAYDASRHPDVLAGRKTQAQVFRDFLETFDVDGVHNGKITWDQWVHYYHNVSASIDDDDYFELMMRNAWHISGGEGWCGNTTNRRVLVTTDDGRDVVREVQDDLGVKAVDVAARLKAQDAAVAKVATAHAMVDATSPPTAQRKIVSLKDASFATPLKASSSPTTCSDGSSVAGDAVYWTIKRLLQRKTLGDVVALRKRAMHYIDAKTGTISAAHCADALSASLGLTLSEPHCVALFEYLNRQPQLEDASDLGVGGASGSIGARLMNAQSQHTRVTIKKLLAGVLGRLSLQNLESARRVYGSLQAAGKGRVFPVALAKSFQAGNHPAVKLGLASAEDIFQDFAASFELSGSPDGSIALEHFEAFCVNWRATLSSDEHLDLLLRECFAG